MVGIFRAWKVNGDVGVERALREAVNSEFQTGSRPATGAVVVDWLGEELSAEGGCKASFVVAILFNKHARWRSKS